MVRGVDPHGLALERGDGVVVGDVEHLHPGTGTNGCSAVGDYGEIDTVIPFPSLLPDDVLRFGAVQLGTELHINGGVVGFGPS